MPVPIADDNTMDRRSFLKRGVGATAGVMLGSRATGAQSSGVVRGRSFDVAVVGAGLFGSTAARYLSTHLEGVALIGPAEPPDRREHRGVFASHHDASRLVRIVDPDPVWGTLAKQSIGRFEALEQATGVPFFRECGYMMVTPGGLGTDWFDFPAMRTVGLDLGVDLETLDDRDLAQRFPDLRFTPGSGALGQARQAGYLDPRGLLMAQQAVAMTQGTTRMTEEVVEIRRSADQVEIRTRSGDALTANRVLVATGASTNACALLGRRLDTSIRAAMTMLARVPESTQLEIPAMLYVKTDGAEPFWGLLMPPVVYPDGLTYVKTMDDHYGETPLQTYDELGDWCRGDGHRDHHRVLRRALREIAPRLDVVETRLVPCLIADTATSYPYVDMIDDRIAVAVGGNGKAAKSSDEIGRLAAELLRTGNWSGTLQPSLFAAQFVEQDGTDTERSRN